jgi:hypothetical protein
MNLKVVNLVAVQFGMFLGIVSWLAYSQLPSGEPRTTAEVRKPMAERMPTFASASNPAEQRSQTVEDRAVQEQTQPVAEQPVVPVVPHEYSPAAVQRYSELAAQQYYQQIAPRRYASAGLANTSFAAVAPSYAEVAPEPMAVQSDDPTPETVAYVQPTQVVVYQQPQFVVFNNSRRFANRCRSTPPIIGTPLANAHRRLNRPRSHLIGSTGFEKPVSPPAASRRHAQSFGVEHRRNDTGPSCRPTQGFAGRGRR